MNDQTPADVPATTTPTSASSAAPTPAASGRTPWRERLLGWRGVAAVAAASIVLGGVGGAVLGTASAGGDDSRSGPGGQHGPGGPGQGHRGPMTGGQLPPSTPPQSRQG